MMKPYPFSGFQDLILPSKTLPSNSWEAIETLVANGRPNASGLTRNWTHWWTVGTQSPICALWSMISLPKVLWTSSPEMKPQPFSGCQLLIMPWKTCVSGGLEDDTPVSPSCDVGPEGGAPVPPSPASPSWSSSSSSSSSCLSSIGGIQGCKSSE